MFTETNSECCTLKTYQFIFPFFWSLIIRPNTAQGEKKRFQQSIKLSLPASVGHFVLLNENLIFLSVVLSIKLYTGYLIYRYWSRPQLLVFSTGTVTLYIGLALGITTDCYWDMSYSYYILQRYECWQWLYFYAI